jgi:DtxR family Mn-dependent transcriptional regulator
MDTSRYPALGDLEPGDTRRVLEVEVEEPEQLRYLGSMDLYPGSEVEVTGKQPFDGPISLQVNGTPQVISHSLAQRIRVRGGGGQEG